MVTNLGTPIRRGGEYVSGKSSIGVERSSSSGGGSSSEAGKGGEDVGRRGGGHFDDIQSNGTENEVDRLD